MEWDAEQKRLALPFGFMLEESLISLVFHSQKEAFTKKRHPAKSIYFARFSAYCSGAMKTINTWLLFSMIWQCTMAQGLSCHQDLESLSLPFSCPFVSKTWAAEGEQGAGGVCVWGGGGGVLALIGRGSSIWNFWSGEPFWTKQRSKPSDEAIYRAADENREAAFDTSCPSICPQTNRMKVWPLIPPLPACCPFLWGPLLKQLRPSEKICQWPPRPHLFTWQRGT